MKMNFIDDWIEEMKEPTEISIIEGIGISVFIFLITFTNDINKSLFPTIMTMGLVMVIGHIIKKREFLEKKRKFI
jgi:hypothetical protein